MSTSFKTPRSTTFVTHTALCFTLTSRDSVSQGCAICQLRPERSISGTDSSLKPLQSEDNTPACDSCPGLQPAHTSSFITDCTGSTQASCRANARFESICACHQHFMSTCIYNNCPCDYNSAAESYSNSTQGIVCIQ